MFNSIRRIEKKLLRNADGTTPAERELLFEIFSSGSESVPGLAYKRSVSRQNVQQTVNSLESKKLVERQENPMHKRSVRYSLTLKGKENALDMIRRERKLYQEMRLEIETGRIRSAVKVINAINISLEKRKLYGNR